MPGFWKQKRQKEFFISRSGLYMYQNTLTVIDSHTDMQVKKLVANKNYMFENYNFKVQNSQFHAN